MAELTKETIDTIAELCRIHCSEEEKEQLLHDLQRILDYADQVQQVDTEDVPPCNNVIAGMENVMREDEVHDVMPREVFLENAPDQIGGMIRVPPVIHNKQ